MPQDVPAVAEFLSTHMNERVPAERWASAVTVPWPGGQPNAGFMLADGDAVVGAHLAFYSERTIAGRRERFCNLAAWCVLPDYRLQSVGLLKALLSQSGYHFTDLSPSGSVVGINRRLGFRHLDVSTRWIPHLPRPTWPDGGEIITDPVRIEACLTGRDLRLFRDHAETQASHHAVLRRGAEVCYVIFRHEQWKRLSRFASLLYVSNPRLLDEMTGRFVSHMLLRRGIVATLAEERVSGGWAPLPSLRVRPLRPRMFRSDSLRPEDIDYLYSEMTCLAW